MPTAPRFLLILPLVLVPLPLRAGDLFQAINNDSAAEVRRLLADDPALANKANANGDLPLHVAPRGANLDIVRALIEAKADVRALDPNVGITPLHVAAVNDRKEAAELLIARGADVNAPNRSDGFTPLHSAALGGSLEVARLLLAKGAKVEGGWDGKTSRPAYPPLHAAVREGHVRVARLLLTKGANPNSGQFGFSTTPLTLAAEVGDLDLLEVLLAKGARVDSPGALEAALSHGRRDVVERMLARGADATAPDHLLLACQLGGVDLVKMLLARGASVRAAGRQGRTPLHAAAQGGNAAVVALLLARGADVTARDEASNAPLHQTPSGTVEGRGLGLAGPLPASGRAVAELLLTKGADVNAANHQGQTTAFLAAQRGDRALLEYLAAKGADLDVYALTALGRADTLRKRLGTDQLPEAPGEYLHTLLPVAALFGQTATAEVLLGKGADVNAAGVYGMRPLHLAAAGGDTKMAEFLLKHGADVNAPMSAKLYVNQRATPLQLALENGHPDMAALLASKGGLPKLDAAARAHWLRLAVQKRQLGLVLWLEQQGTRMDPQQFGGQTPLHLAAEVGDRAVVERLLARGADLKAINQAGGLTPLHQAIRGQHQPIVELLLDRGADVKQNAPLVAAVQTGNVDIAALLIARGAEVRTGDVFSSPLRGACALGKPEMVKLLLDHGADVKQPDGGFLHEAARRGHRAVVERLLDRGAGVNARLADGFQLYYWGLQREPEVLDLLREAPPKKPGAGAAPPSLGTGGIVGGTPLLAAVVGKQKEIAEILIGKGADVRARLPAGGTLLHVAAARGDVAMIRFLLAQGLAVGDRDGRGRTPLDLAVQAEEEEAACVLQARAPKE
jgi:ankyrin repeat protein